MKTSRSTYNFVESNSFSFPCDRLRQLTVYCWNIINRIFHRLIILDKYTYEQLHLKLLSAIHEELGLRSYCWRAHGILLNLMFEDFPKQKDDMPKDTIQILCLCGIRIPDEGGFPVTHNSPANDESIALKISGFLGSFVISKYVKHKFQKILKMCLASPVI